MKEANRDQLRLRNHIFRFKEEVNIILSFKKGSITFAEFKARFFLLSAFCLRPKHLCGRKEGAHLLVLV